MELAVINFGNLNIQVYGDEETPLIRCQDLLIHVLGYKRSGDARWYREMSQEHRELYIIQQEGETPSFNEQGIYWALMKSNKPIASQFQLAVCNWLKQTRIHNKTLMLENKRQLEEQKQLVAMREKEIQELKAPKPASIYKLIYKDRLLYIGKDKSKAQNRPQQHLTERRKIAQNNQIIDIFLASIQEKDIKIEITPCLDYEADALERTMIQQLQPELNQSMNDNLYICEDCDPQKIYKNRANYEKHLIYHN